MIFALNQDLNMTIHQQMSQLIKDCFCQKELAFFYIHIIYFQVNIIKKDLECWFRYRHCNKIPLPGP